MRILAIGDFHGKFPKKLVGIIKKEKIQLIVSVGDYFPFHYRKLWFKHCYGKDVELWEIIGKKKCKEFISEDLKRGGRVLRKLNKLGIKIISVVGNVDYTGKNDVYDIQKRKGRYWDWEQQDFFSEIIKKYKNITRFDYGFVKIRELVFIGASGSSFPGHVKSKAYRKSRRILERLFKKFRKGDNGGRIVFVSHNVPYNTKIDKISSEEAPEEIKRKHYGSKLIRRIIDKYQPILAIGGHIHEAWGRDRLGRTICINAGAVYEGRGAVIDIIENFAKTKFSNGQFGKTSAAINRIVHNNEMRVKFIKSLSV